MHIISAWPTFIYIAKERLRLEFTSPLFRGQFTHPVSTACILKFKSISLQRFLNKYATNASPGNLLPIRNIIHKMAWGVSRDCCYFWAAKQNQWVSCPVPGKGGRQYQGAMSRSSNGGG